MEKFIFMRKNFKKNKKKAFLGELGPLHDAKRG
jgi:hypothetical protein